MYRALFASVVLAGLALAAAPPPCCVKGPYLDYAPTVQVHSLIKLAVLDVPAGAAVSWSYDHDQVDAHEDGARLTATAPPGRYRFVALVVSIEAGKPVVSQLRASVDVLGKTPNIPPSTPPSTKPPGKGPDARAALCMLSFAGGRCTATVIGPRRTDGRWDVLTAHHCMPRPSTRGQITTSTGKKLAVRRVAADSVADLCWMVTDDVVDDLPYAMLAAERPAVGVELWHAGFGVDKPGNVERGRVYESNGARGQLGMILSVSSGDSGGGIFRADTNELVSCVCCTKSPSPRGASYGGSSVDAIKLRPK